MLGVFVISWGKMGQEQLSKGYWTLEKKLYQTVWFIGNLDILTIKLLDFAFN